jgi:phosphatidate cytidylyltransferase
VPDQPDTLKPAAAPVRWSDLRKRILSAAILAPLALVCLWAGGWPWTGLVAAASVGLAAEWVHLCRAPVLRLPGVLVPLAVLVAGAAAVAGQPALAVLLLAVGAMVVLAAGRRPALAAGVPYAGLGVVCLVWLRDDALAGAANVVFLLLVVWASDIGAYVAGRLIGGPKLAPAISPGKTWAGSAGGLVAAMAVGWLAAHLLGPEPGLRVLAVAAGLGVATQVGDLLESWIKRRFGVKDSSHLIPGHGGLLDRLDGLMAAAPAAAALAALLGPGVVLWR